MNVYKGRLLKKSSNQKSKLVLSTLVTPWLPNIAFHLRPIWLQTLVAIDSELRLTSFPSFCAPPSEVAALFDSNMSRRPSLDRSLIQTCYFAQDSIQNMLFSSCVIILLRDEWMIESLSEAIGAALVGNNFSPIPWKFHSTWKKKWLVTAQNLQSIKTLFALELNQCRKSGSTFSSSEPVAASSDCCWLGNALCLCLPIRPAQAEQESGPKSLAVDFAL